MVKTLRLLMLLFLMILPFSIVVGQDANFTQFINTPIYYNPALTGANVGLHTASIVRAQWMKLPIPYKAFNFEGDVGIRSIPGIGGFGLTLSQNNEGIGFIQDLQIGISFSSRIKFSSLLAMQIGLKASVIQKKINWDDFVFSDQIGEEYGNIYQSGFIPPDSQTKRFADFALGAVLQFNNRNGIFRGSTGIAADHLFQPDQSFISSGKAPLGRKYNFHADFVITTTECSTCKLKGAGFADPLKIMPAFLYQFQNNHGILHAGFNLTKFNFTLGLWGRHQARNWYSGENISYDNYSILLGYRIFFTKSVSLNLTYSMDLANKYSPQQPYDAHEFCLSLDISKFK
jgi:type IX secretion system PorP/SprF family membrane protein